MVSARKMMKLSNIISIVVFSLFSLFSLFSTQVLSDIRLTTPNQLKIKLVNGQSAKDVNPLILKDGSNQIAFSYQDRYREDGEDIFFTSDIIVMTFSGNDQEYFISLPTLNSQKERESFNKKPLITLTNKSAEPVSFEQSKLIKNGLQFNRDLVAEITAYNQTSKPASLNQNATITAPTANIAPTANQSEADVAGKMLDYWYNKADPKTQAAFKKRINN